MKKWAKKAVEEETSENPFERKKQEPKARKSLKTSFPKSTIDQHKTIENILEATGGKDRWQKDIDLFKSEWAMTEQRRSPGEWLHEVKGYTRRAATRILTQSGGMNAWEDERRKVQDKVLATVVKRHVDTIADVNDQHIRSSKLGLARAIEMLTNNHVKQLRKVGEEYTLVELPLRSMDLVNCMTAIEKAQQIYRRAMGLPSEEGGLTQILARLESLPQTTVNIQQNIQNNGVEPWRISSDVEKQLTYDDLMEFVRLRREQKNGIPKTIDVSGEPKE